MFTKIFGENPQTKLLDFLADHPDHDYTIADLVKKTGVSKPTIYKILPKLLKENLVVVTRKVGKAKLYKLNTENELVKLILKFEFELANLLKDRNSKVITPRIIPLEEAKKEILKYLETREDVVYTDEIAEALNLDFDLTHKALMELWKDGEVDRQKD